MKETDPTITDSHIFFLEFASTANSTSNGNCSEGGTESVAIAGYAIIVFLITHCGKMHAIKSILRSFKLWAPVSHMRGGR
jgi:hypothetical protein